MKQIPTIQELKDNVSNDLKSRLNISDTDLKTVLDTVSGVLSGQFKLAYFFLSDIQKNIFPDTADSESNGGTLERLGRIHLKRNPFPATIGKFTISVNGVAGSVLRSGLTFKSNDTSKNPGQLFVLNSEYTLVGLNDEVQIQSTLSGIGFDLNVNDTLTITEPVIGVENTVTVLSVIEQPKAQEDLEEYRQKIIDSIQLEPQGGAKTDYMLWALDAQGVRRVYPYVRSGEAGTIDVYVEASIIDSLDGKGTPTQEIKDDVLSVLIQDPDVTKPTLERGRKPMQANLSINDISLIPVDVTISGLNISTNTIQTSIQTSIENHLYTVRPFIEGADLSRNRNDVLYSGRLQSVITDGLDSNNYFNSFSMSVNGVNVSNYQFSLGNIPYLRNLIFD